MTVLQLSNGAEVTQSDAMDLRCFLDAHKGQRWCWDSCVGTTRAATEAQARLRLDEALMRLSLDQTQPRL